MKTILILLLLALSQSLIAQESHLDQIMISQGETKTKLTSPELIILHVGSAQGYNKGHIPGALFMGNRDYVTVTPDSIYTELPGAENFEKALQARGITRKSEIILCSDWESFAQAFRLYFTFDYYGLNKYVRILDGGIKGWASMELPVSTDTVVAATSSKKLKPRDNTQLLVDKNWIRENYKNDNVVIVDARTVEYYSGEKDGDGYYKRPGHIVGAKNITWKSLVDDNHFLLDESVLKKRFDDLGITADDTLVNYCHVGLRASVLYTIGKGLGFQSMLYDGSYNEWDRLGEGYGFEQSKH